MDRIIEGVETVAHADGSYTTYTVEHFPHQEPLSGKATAGIFLGTLAFMGVMVGLPVWLENRAERIAEKNTLKARQKKNREIFYQAKNA